MMKMNLMKTILDKTKIMSKVNSLRIWEISTPASHSKFDNLLHLKPTNLILDTNLAMKLVISTLIKYPDIVEKKMMG